MDQLKKTVLSTTADFAKKNRTMLDSAADLVPQARIARRASKLALGIVIAISIILVIISIALFTNKHPTAGVWLLGASITLGSFTIWFHFYRQNMIGAFGGDEFEILDNVYEEYEPQDYDYLL
jgi:hypothetical protein